MEKVFDLSSARNGATTLTLTLISLTDAETSYVHGVVLGLAEHRLQITPQSNGGFSNWKGYLLTPLPGCPPLETLWHRIYNRLMSEGLKVRLY